MKKYSFTIFIPVYNGAKTIKKTLLSVFSQDYSNFKVIIQDNNSTDNTIDVVKSFNHSKIKIFKNKTSLGYNGNLNAGIKNCHDDIVLLLAADDILSKNALSLYNKAFNLSKNIGAVTRPYFWFEKDIDIPVRTKKQLNSKKDTIVKITDNPKKVIRVFETLDQLSGLAMKLKYIDILFGKEDWISHAYPFVSIFTKHPIVYLKDYTTAVYIGSSATRSNIYQKSPISCWINMLNLTITRSNQQIIKKKIIKDFIATNYIGILQIKNYGSCLSLYREIYFLLKYRPINILNFKFWLFTLFTVFTPKFISKNLTDWIKEKINSKLINQISFPK
ncbi:MAG: glycosyltransferase family A protein [Candidatus Shapirobacteria bacterium]|jgi:glycosyltransferase involved in cell wall biosynthesis